MFALAVALALLGQLLRDFGVAEYIIAQSDVTLQKKRAAFTLTLLIALAISAVLLGVSGPLARLYGEPGVKSVLQVLSINFVLLPFGSVGFAMMSKELRFEQLFWIQSLAATLGTGLTLFLAFHGFSYMSMAWGSLASTSVVVTTMMLLRGRSFFLCPTFHGLKDVLAFGGVLTGARLLEQAAFRSQDLIVSGFLGFHAGGILSKTNSLVGSFNDVFNSAVVRVAVPVFAQSLGNLEAIRSQYVKATTLVFTAQWLFFPALGIFAKEIVAILLGPAWADCVPLLQICAAASLAWAPYMLSVPLLTALGSVRDLLRIQVVSAPLLVLSFLVGAQLSLLWVVVLCSIVVPVRLYMIDRSLYRNCGIRFGETARFLLPSIKLAGIVAVIAIAVRHGLIWLGLPASAVLLVGAAAAIGSALVAANAMGHPLLHELNRIFPLIRTPPEARR